MYLATYPATPPPLLSSNGKMRAMPWCAYHDSFSTRHRGQCQFQPVSLKQRAQCGPLVNAPPTISAWMWAVPRNCSSTHQTKRDIGSSPARHSEFDCSARAHCRNHERKLSTAVVFVVSIRRNVNVAHQCGLPRKVPMLCARAVLGSALLSFASLMSHTYLRSFLCGFQSPPFVAALARFRLNARRFPCAVAILLCTSCMRAHCVGEAYILARSSIFMADCMSVCALRDPRLGFFFAMLTSPPS